MPTPGCHSLSRVLDGMFHATADKAALGLATALGASAWWHGYLREISDVSVLLGPPLAALFVGARFVLTLAQIRKEWRRAPPQ